MRILWLLLLLTYGSIASVNGQGNPITGMKFPEFNLKDINGFEITNLTFQKNIVVVSFWNMECQYCKKEISELNRIVDKYQRRGVLFFAPASNDKLSLKTFLSKTEFRYHVLAESVTLEKELNIEDYPLHLVLDKYGIIRDVIPGNTPNIYKALEDSLKTVMKKSR